MESNEQAELTRKTGTDSWTGSRLTAKESKRCRGSKKEKGLGDMSNSVVIVGGGGIRGLNGDGEKIQLKNPLYENLQQTSYCAVKD